MSEFGDPLNKLKPGRTKWSDRIITCISTTYLAGLSLLENNMGQNGADFHIGTMKVPLAIVFLGMS